MVICLERAADLHTAQLMPPHSLSLASIKSRLVLPFWYWPTWVVPEKGPLNVCVCVCLCVRERYCLSYVTFLPMQCYASAVSAMAPCLSVTSWSSFKTDERIELIFGRDFGLSCTEL